MLTRFGVIDVGTNTLRLIIGEPGENQVPRFTFQKVIATRLGEGLDKTGELSQAAMARTTQALKELIGIAKEHKVNLLEAYATAWARKAANTDEMLSAFFKLESSGLDSD